MKTDNELTEMAARACALPECGWMGPVFTYVKNHQFTDWSPLTNDGDAFRLAVAMGIEWRKPSRNRSLGSVVNVWYPPDGNPEHAACIKLAVHIKGDTLAATRRAIVIAAARMFYDKKKAPK